jgi:signal transduction histidine kinase
MDLVFYLRLFASTAGALLYLFLLVLLAGLRRPRRFESLLFLTGLCVFIYYAGNLLLLNLLFYYAAPPPVGYVFALALNTTGLLFFPALLVHAHAEFYRKLEEGRRPPWLVGLVGMAYLTLAGTIGFNWWHQGGLFYVPECFGGYFAVSWPSALVIAAAFQRHFARRAVEAGQAELHRMLSILLAVLGFLYLVGAVAGVTPLGADAAYKWLEIAFYLSLLLPGAVLGYFFVRQRFLPLGVQRHLVFTVSGAFLALLYLTVALRLSEWLKDFLPPVATLSILLFVLVIFFEPLQRRVGTILQRTFRQEAERLQRLTAEIQHVARTGDLEQLVNFAEARIRDSFALADVRIVLPEAAARPLVPSARVQRFELRSGPAEIGAIEAWFYGQTLSGETFAALSYLSEQLPAAIDLCRLLEEKLRLERELAERERFALVGQMAASISHNLKNPLSSMKMLLQVQMENPDLPASLRKDCALVVEEIDRLSAKLGQLLQFARPLVRSGVGQLKVGVCVLAEQLVGLLRHEAERHGVVLEFLRPAEELFVWGSEPALSDVLTNLLVNAIEALSAGGTLRLAIERRDAEVVIEVADNGPGISPEVQAKIFRPFYTTKPRGTGLGLAIVERRLAELKGTIRCESPLRDARGTRFTVTLPVAETMAASPM